MRENNIAQKENNWYVITGAPHSGKTSVLELLDQKGHKVVYEAARIYIDREVAKGREIEEIRKDEAKFQEKILSFKIDIEKRVPQNEKVFFDRAIPDSYAYNKLIGINNSDLTKILKKCYYKKVFLFEPLPYKQDYARIETEEEQIKLHHLLKETYQKFNFPTVVVPPMNSKEDRLKFIINNL